MLRQLLTLLALISGLGLATTPAVAAQANVVSVAAMADSEDCKSTASRPLELVSIVAGARDARKPCKPRPMVVWTPTVQLQVDRSRE